MSSQPTKHSVESLPDMGAVDWGAFMEQHDLHFDQLPQKWQEAPHFGNGLVGSMLYQVDDAIRLQVFRSDVHDHRDESYGWTAYSRPRFVIGHFTLKPVGKLTGCRWRKDLSKVKQRFHGRGSLRRRKQHGRGIHVMGSHSVLMRGVMVNVIAKRFNVTRRTPMDDQRCVAMSPSGFRICLLADNMRQHGPKLKTAKRAPIM